MFEERTENAHLVGESESLATNGATAVPSEAIKAALGGNKIILGVNITVAGGAAAAPLGIQYSHNGKDWSASDQVAASIAATTTGVKLFLHDLTGVRAPYFRLVMEGVASLGTTGRFSFIYATPPARQ